jgi:hypothetical protein
LVAQQTEVSQSTLKGLRIHWLKHIILALWKFHNTMWDHRNSILHANSARAIAIRDSPLDARISSLYRSIESFAATDRVLFNIPLDIRLSHSRRAKKHWVALATRYQGTTTSRQKAGQQLLTKFFLRQSTATMVSTPFSEHANAVPIDLPHQQRRPHEPG